MLCHAARIPIAIRIAKRIATTPQSESALRAIYTESGKAIALATHGAMAMPVATVKIASGKAGPSTMIGVKTIARQRTPIAS